MNVYANVERTYDALAAYVNVCYLCSCVCLCVCFTNAQLGCLQGFLVKANDLFQISIDLSLTLNQFLEIAYRPSKDSMFDLCLLLHVYMLCSTRDFVKSLL